MSDRLWVGLIGPAGSGKTTAAHGLVEHGFRLERFASPLKDMLRAAGLTYEQVDGDQKEEPCDLLCGKSPRFAMQKLGTEWGRETIGQDLWVRMWRHRVRDMPLVVADDVRFPNEVEAIRNYSDRSVIIRVVRPEHVGTSLSQHVSETHDLLADAEVQNVRTPTSLTESVLAVIKACTA